MSGGADSLALLVLAAAAGCDVTAIHVEHGLRAGSGPRPTWWPRQPRGSGHASSAARVSLAPGPNLEARARAARFAVLPADVATGHTMDDQAETILVNLLRGPGRTAWRAWRRVPGTRCSTCAGARRTRLCADVGLEPVCDPSNADPAYVRNRVRHELLPLSAEVAGRDPVPLLARQAGVLREEAALLESLAAEALPDPADARPWPPASRPLARRAPALAARVGAGADADAGRRPPALAGRGRAHPRRGAGDDASGPSSAAAGGCVGRAAVSGWSRGAPVVSRR